MVLALKNTHIDEWNKIRSPKINSYTYGQLISKNEGKMVVRKLDTCKRMKLDHFLTLYMRTDSKRTKDLNVRPETIKLLEENIGSKPSDISLSNIFSDISPQAMVTKEKIIKWGYIKLKSFCKVNKMKRQHNGWENTLCNNTSDKGLISKIYHKNLYNSTPEKQCI